VNLCLVALPTRYRLGPPIRTPALRFWSNVRGGDKDALSPDRLVAYLPGNNLASFGRTGTNLLKLGALPIILALPNSLAQGRLEKTKGVELDRR
jgi:hypothetical protein